MSELLKAAEALLERDAPVKVCHDCLHCKAHCLMPSDYCSTIDGICPECANATGEQQ